MKTFRSFRLFLVLCAALSFGACQIIDEGTVGVSRSFGKLSDETLKPGVYFQFPVVRDVIEWDVKTQSGALEVSIPSAEGLIVSLQTTVLFRPVDSVRLQKEVGRDYVRTVLQPRLIDTVRQVIGKNKVENIITSQETLSEIIGAQLKESMALRGVVIEKLLVTGLELPINFRQAVERKLEQEQKALQKRFELDSAKKDAEIEVARAKGAAQAQEIVRSTLSAEYLQYLWISTLNQNPNVIYVATEANMPLFRTSGGAALSGSN